MYPEQYLNYVQDAFTAWFKVFAQEAASRIRISAYKDSYDLSGIVILPPNLDNYDENNDPQGFFKDVGECYKFSDPVFNYDTVADGMNEISIAVQKLLLVAYYEPKALLMSANQFGEELALSQFCGKANLSRCSKDERHIILNAPKLDLTYDGESAGFKRMEIPSDDECISPEY